VGSPIPSLQYGAAAACYDDGAMRLA
jgi:hypothetical protein